jgi:uncharacterized protein
MDEINKSFFGKGWSFPPTFSSNDAVVIVVSDLEDIGQSLNILLSTSLGERIKREEYGSGLGDFVFEPTSNSGLTIMRSMVEKAILIYESRIRLNNLKLETDVNEGIVNILIDFTIRTTNSRHNFVYPFYIKEANNL